MLSCFCVSAAIPVMVDTNGTPYNLGSTNAWKTKLGFFLAPTNSPSTNSTIAWDFVNSRPMWVYQATGTNGSNATIYTTYPLSSSAGTNGIVLSIAPVWITQAQADALYAAISHTHTTNQITGLNSLLSAIAASVATKEPAIASGPSTNVLFADKSNGPQQWANIANKPSTFAPSAHGHVESDVTGLVADLANKHTLGSTATNSVKTGGRSLAWDDYATLWGKLAWINDSGSLDTGLGLRFYGANNNTQWATLTADSGGDLYASTHKIWNDYNLQFGTGHAQMMRGDTTFATNQITGFSGFSDTMATQLTGKAASSHTHDWTTITGKPTSFQPIAHGHAESDITGLVADLAGKHSLGSTVTNSLALQNMWPTVSASAYSIFERDANGSGYLNGLYIPGDNSYSSGTPAKFLVKLTGGASSTFVFEATPAQTKASLAITTNDLPGLNTRLDNLWTGIGGREPSLGVPSLDGRILSSSMAGARSWISPPAGFPGFGGTGSGTLASRYDHTHSDMLIGSGTAGRIPMFSSSNSLTNSNFYDNGGGADGGFNGNGFYVNVLVAGSSTATRITGSTWLKTPTLYLTCTNGLQYPLRVVLLGGTPTLSLGPAESPP